MGMQSNYNERFVDHLNLETLKKKKIINFTSIQNKAIKSVAITFYVYLMQKRAKRTLPLPCNHFTIRL
jgi:hypothetical protein